MESSSKIVDSLEYSLVQLIATGGMGTVYRAEQKGIGDFVKTVAIKVIREEYSALKPFRDNFIGEAKLVSDLIHSNIVQIYHLGKLIDNYYMVMEFVNGINLDDFIVRHVKKGKQIPTDLAVFIISRICRGLAYAHVKRDGNGLPLGIVHRDVNPKNIMVSREGDVKLTDFGIAKAKDLMYNEEGKVIAGKEGYIAPEQARREVTDARADLFSCGIVLAELLLGRNLFDDRSPSATLKNILEKPIPDFRELRPDIDDNLNRILNLSLTRDRSKRYQSASEMLIALEFYIYKDGYGPTNEKLSYYMHDLLR